MNFIICYVVLDAMFLKLKYWWLIHQFLPLAFKMGHDFMTFCDLTLWGHGVKSQDLMLHIAYPPQSYSIGEHIFHYAIAWHLQMVQNIKIPIAFPFIICEVLLNLIALDVFILIALWGIIKLFIFIKSYNLLNYFKLSLKFKYVMWLKIDVDGFLTFNHHGIGYRNFFSNQFWDNSIHVI